MAFSKRSPYPMPCKLCISPFRDLVDKKLESGVSLGKVRKWLLEQGFSVGLTTVFRHSRHYIQARRTVERIMAQKRPDPQVAEELSFNLNILNELIDRYLYSATASPSYCVVLHKLLAERRLTLMALAELTGQSSRTGTTIQAQSPAGTDSLWNEVKNESEKLKRELDDARKGS